MRIETLRKRYGLKLRWIHFPLHPETSQEGLDLDVLFRGREAQYEAMKVHLRQVAAEEGLPLAERSRTHNSRLAQELACWAETQEGGERIHDALFVAYFVDGKDISDVEVLVEVAEGAGLSGEEARRVLGERSFRAAVNQDWHRSRLSGVTGVPTFVAGRRAVVGAQPYEALEELVVRAGAKPPAGRME